MSSLERYRFKVPLHTIGMEPYRSPEPRVRLDLNAALLGLNTPAERRALERELDAFVPSKAEEPEKLEMVLYEPGPYRTRS